ncbi:MAG: helix-turn-helix domain-containing protein, partial [Propionibacteriaceae bacterium]|nr:helix-turn-helix domain-containing protein [Propionibacteriaceae bacterium]
MAILNLIAQRPGGWSLTKIASSLGLAKSSVLTILTSLEAAGMVSRTDNYYDLDVGVLTPAGG